MNLKILANRQEFEPGQKEFDFEQIDEVLDAPSKKLDKKDLSDYLDRIINQVQFAPWAKDEFAADILNDKVYLKRWSQANIDIVPVGASLLSVSPYNAPAAALDPNCGTDLWEDDFGEAGEFFRMHSVDTFLGSSTGYGSPITAFVVKKIWEGGFIKRGCSMALFEDYLLVSILGLNNPPSRVLAHELAHTCGLAVIDILHHSSENNLMNVEGLSGVNLTNYQVARLRNSPHVIPF